MTALEGFTAAIVKPGDTLVIAFNYNVTDEDIENLTEAWKPVTDLGVQIAFADSVKSMVVVRPGEEEK